MVVQPGTPKTVFFTTRLNQFLFPGRYGCYVADSEERSSSLNIDVQVISPPVVLLTPRSLTVESGSYVIVTCTLTQPLDSEKDFRFLWYRNGSALQLQAGR